MTMDLSLKPYVDAAAEAMAQVVGEVEGKPVTRGELSAAFDTVANKANWKCPIDARVWLDSHDIAVLTEAVRFFAGCLPEFQKLTRRKGGKARYRVTAAGYYESVGA